MSIYTLIPQKSLDAFIHTGSLSEVLSALIIDPDEAEDYVREHGNDAPHSMRDFMNLGRKALTSALQTTAEWTLRYGDPERAIRGIVRWDRRLGIWCCCAAVGPLLSLMPASEERPRAAVEAALGWAARKVNSRKAAAASQRSENAAEELAERGMILESTIAQAASLPMWSVGFDDAYTGRADPQYAENFINDLLFAHRFLRTENAPALICNQIADACLRFPR
jgi:hypothetical protein